MEMLHSDSRALAENFRSSSGPHSCGLKLISFPGLEAKLRWHSTLAQQDWYLNFLLDWQIK